jgi:hypothetical protein
MIGNKHVCIASLIVVFTVYWRSLSPNIAGGDSGELVAEGCILGTSHPPGYPLLSMIIYAIKSINLFPTRYFSFTNRLFLHSDTSTLIVKT